MLEHHDTALKAFQALSRALFRVLEHHDFRPCREHFFEYSNTMISGLVASTCEHFFECSNTMISDLVASTFSSARDRSHGHTYETGVLEPLSKASTKSLKCCSMVYKSTPACWSRSRKPPSGRAARSRQASPRRHRSRTSAAA